MSDEDSSDINASILDIKHNDQVDEFITSEPTSKVNDIHKKIENLVCLIVIKPSFYLNFRDVRH